MSARSLSVYCSSGSATSRSSNSSVGTEVSRVGMIAAVTGAVVVVVVGTGAAAAFLRLFCVGAGGARRFEGGALALKISPALLLAAAKRDRRVASTVGSHAVVAWSTSSSSLPSMAAF